MTLQLCWMNLRKHSLSLSGAICATDDYCTGELEKCSLGKSVCYLVINAKISVAQS